MITATSTTTATSMTAATAPLRKRGGSAHEHQHYEKSYVLFHVRLLEEGAQSEGQMSARDSSRISREFQP
jgi:hypothetical protein